LSIFVVEKINNEIMNATAIAHIDISRPSGRKIVREIESRRAIKMEYPKPAEITEQKWVSHEDFWGEMEQKLNAHYGTNYKLNL